MGQLQGTTLIQRRSLDGESVIVPEYCSRRSLKLEKETAVNNLPPGRDVMAVLPHRLWQKHDFFTVFALARQEMSSTTSIIVIPPSKSIIDNQISQML